MPGERGFWPALALVLAGHGAVLTQWRVAPSALEDPQAVQQASQVFRVRTIQPAPSTEPAPPPRPTNPPSVVAPITAAPPQPPVSSSPAPEVESSTVAIAAPPVDLPYLPRHSLTVGPKLKASVDVPFPEEVQGVVNLTVQATLFIDEDGSVRRVRVDTPDVQPQFETAIQQAFAHASFSPGEVEGLPVRSQMRVEIEFQAPASRR